jgi:hypothetical protein
MDLDKDQLPSRAGSTSSFAKNPDDYIYENIGSEEGVCKAIDHWADLLMKNDLLKSVFENVDMVTMKALQRRYMMLVTTQHKLPVRDIEVLMGFYSKFNLTDAHFDEIKNIYSTALIMAGSMPLIADLALDRIEKTRDYYLGRYDCHEDTNVMAPLPAFTTPSNYLILPIQEMSIIGEAVFSDPFTEES